MQGLGDVPVPGVFPSASIRYDRAASRPSVPAVTSALGHPSGGAEPDGQIQRRLQQDSIVLAGRTVFLNPFLYWRRFDANTDRWLREPGQLPEEQILSNRLRFYPELDWEGLDPGEIAVKEGAVEMFLKSLELISTFNPDLSAGHLLEVERKMAVTKKKAFERWVARALERREKESRRERRRFDRERMLRGWMEWFALDVTRQALLPVTLLLVLAVAGGWWLGSSRFCSKVIVAPGVQRPPL